MRQNTMKVMSVVGARPNFMKAAPIISAIQAHNERARGNPGETIRHVLVHTGQHYDQLMSEAFFTDLGLPRPDVHLGAGSGSHAAQTAEIMKLFEGVLLQEQPDVLIVVGDVNSTLACALVAAKISFDAFGRRPLIAHVEAGLRSFDRTMPEEINRVLTDQVSDLLFVTEASGLRNLAREGFHADRVHFVGNTMIDSLLACKDRADESRILDDLGFRNGAPRSILDPYALLTLHRPSNVDSRDAFLNILDGLEELARELPVVFPAHPRTRKRVQEFGLEGRFGAGAPGAIRMIEPLGYLDFLCLMKHARLVVTDSGGIQEETTCLHVPCVTVRENTERPATVTAGSNVIAGVCAHGIRATIRRQLESSAKTSIPEKWDGRSALRITKVLLEQNHGYAAAPLNPGQHGTSQ